MRKCCMCGKEKEEHEFQEMEFLRGVSLPPVLEGCRTSYSCRECNKKPRGKITWWKRLKHLFGIHTFEMTAFGFRYCFICRTSEILSKIPEAKPTKKKPGVYYFRARECKNYESDEKG